VFEGTLPKKDEESTEKDPNLDAVFRKLTADLPPAQQTLLGLFVGDFKQAFT
jgi:hypothetical protein